MDSGGGASEPTRLVEVRLVTKLPNLLRVPKTSIKVPSNLTRMGLSEIVNSILQSVDEEFERLPFDFIVDGELIRMPLEQFLLVKGISAEKVLEIEYIKAVVPKREQDPRPHDDWVSAVDGSNSSFVLTGCYDGRARIWKNGSFCTYILEGHADAVTSVRVLNQKGGKNGSDLLLATASKDQTVRIWKFDPDTEVNNATKIWSFKTLRGHKKSVQSISSDPAGNMLCSGSWDCSIKIWKVEDETEEDSVVKKRRVRNDDMTSHQESQLEGTAFSTIEGHTQCVSSVVWPKLQTLYSASWDHSIRIWDVESGSDSWNMVSEKAHNCLDVGGEGSALILAGGSDPVLRVWDPRKPGTPGSFSPVFQFTSHASWIAGCKWHKTSSFHFVSASYDGKVMLWDLRTAWPLAVIDSHTDKVLCADWWKDDSIVSGGADSKMFISSGISIH